MFVRLHIQGFELRVLVYRVVLVLPVTCPSFWYSVCRRRRQNHDGHQGVFAWEGAALPGMGSALKHGWVVPLFEKISKRQIRPGPCGQLACAAEGFRVLELHNFACDADPGTRIHPPIRFAYQPWDPPEMRDTEGRRIRYFGRCTLGFSTTRCIIDASPLDEAVAEEAKP